MRVMVLVPAVPATLESKVPWHFFQELRPMAEHGVRFRVLSAVQPEYEIPGIEFRQIQRQSLKKGSRELAQAIAFAWNQRGLLPSRKLKDIRNNIKLCQWNAYVSRNIREWRPDIIHSHWAFPAGSAGMLAASEFHIPSIMTLRGIEHQVVPKFQYGHCLDPFYEKTLTLALKNATRITVCCSDSVERIKQLGVYDPGKIVHIYHAVNASRFDIDRQGIEPFKSKLGLDGKQVILCIARMEDQGRKGHHTLIDAFARLFKGASDKVLMLVGYGPDEVALKQLVRERGVESQVLFYGGAHPKEIACLLSLATLSVLPSYSESFANVVFESLICGTPVISSAVGTPKDVLPMGPYGHLFNAGQVDELCDCIQKVFTDLPAAKAMAERGGEYVRSHMGIENRISSFIQTYNEIARN